ncbi:hypothetical protein K523DRAFT_333282 [Schizophyllum commune Tattone D]|nr:hypothetical protein K523DRAFT_333282 [Schizophyllum commune Tattone D]
MYHWHRFTLVLYAVAVSALGPQRGHCAGDYAVGQTLYLPLAKDICSLATHPMLKIFGHPHRIDQLQKMTHEVKDVARNVDEVFDVAFAIDSRMHALETLDFRSTCILPLAEHSSGICSPDIDLPSLVDALRVQLPAVQADVDRFSASLSVFCTSWSNTASILPLFYGLRFASCAHRARFAILEYTLEMLTFALDGVGSGGGGVGLEGGLASLEGEIPTTGFVWAWGQRTDSVAFTFAPNLPPNNVASEASGAQIAFEFTSPTYGLSSLTQAQRAYRWMTGKDGRHTKNMVLPDCVISTSCAKLGSCWKSASAVGHIGIRLQRPTIISSVSIYHPGDRDSDDGPAGPRRIMAWGLVGDKDLDGDDGLITVEVDHFWQRNSNYTDIQPVPTNSRFLLIGEWEHPARLPSGYVVFDVPESVPKLSSNLMVLEVRSNWDAHKNTCLYAVGIHGYHRESV